MKIIIVLLLMLACCNAFSQRNDTTWWKKSSKIQSIIKTTGNEAIINCWHANGRLMCKGKFNLKSGPYRPASDMVILDSNGKKVQKYIYTQGKLINYLPGGIIVKDVLSAPLYDTAQSFVEYYSNGTVMTKESARKDTGKNGIYFFPPRSHDGKIAYMYQQERFSYNYKAQYYPNGKLYYKSELPKEGNKLMYGHTWFKPSGKIDTSAFLSAKQHTYPLEKQGRRLEWWNNGKLKKEENYKNDQKHGAQRSWYENGRKETEFFFRDGSNDSIARWWYPNGRLHSYNNYRFHSQGNPSLNFHPNGMIQSQRTAIASSYDSSGKLLYEHFEAYSYFVSFDSKNGQQNKNRYVGVFDKMRKGKWMAYDSMGRLMYVTFYKNGLAEGETRIYDTLNHLRGKMYYKEGRPEGPSLIMNANGKDTLHYGSYHSGVRWGVWRSFYNNGRLEKVELYGKGTYEKLEEYDDKGRMLLGSYYDSGKKQEVKITYSGDNITGKNIKQQGSKNADSYQYYPDGKNKRTIIYVKDDSTWERSWFANGNQEIDLYRKNNISSGKMTTWYANGNKKTEGVMKSGSRDGEWIYYKEDGSIDEKPFFDKGVQAIQPPKNNACFCNKTYPAFGSPYYFPSAEEFMPLRSVNRIMQRFQFDSTYKNLFLRNYFTTPVPLIAFNDIKLMIDKDGMFLNFTPCRHGHNYTMVELASINYKHITKEYHDYNHDSDLLIPPALPEVMARSLAIHEYHNLPLSYYQILKDVSGDSLLFHRFLDSNYAVHLPQKALTEEEEGEAIDNAYDNYKKQNGKRDVSFQKDIAYKLADAILPYFSKEAVILKHNPTDREAIKSIMDKVLENREFERMAELVYGALDVMLDSGSVSLHIPLSVITVYDSAQKKSLLTDGKPTPVSFLISYVNGHYESYPKDRLVFLPKDTYNSCAPNFAIGEKGAWIEPGSFRFSFGPVGNYRSYTEEEPFSSGNYPAHPVAGADNYIKNFMGVVVKTGELHLPGVSRPIPVSDVLIDGKEVNGVVKIFNDQKFITEQQLMDAFRSAGFTVFPGDPELDRGYLTVYFNYQKI